MRLVQGKCEQLEVAMVVKWLGFVACKAQLVVMKELCVLDMTWCHVARWRRSRDMAWLRSTGVG